MPILAYAAALVAAASLPADTATVSLSSARAGARPVSVTIALHTELQCGRITGRPLTIAFPAQERVPATVAVSAVLVGGVAASSVSVSGHSLAVGPPRPTGVICDVIAPGVAKIVLTRAAGLGNPAAPGAYVVTVSHRGEARATMRIVARSPS